MSAPDEIRELLRPYGLDHLTDEITGWLAAGWSTDDMMAALREQGELIAIDLNIQAEMLVYRSFFNAWTQLV